jgi:hypothetical protein
MRKINYLNLVKTSTVIRENLKDWLPKAKPSVFEIATQPYHLGFEFEQTYELSMGRSLSTSYDNVVHFITCFYFGT